jgi:hypothetical protein
VNRIIKETRSKNYFGPWRVPKTRPDENMWLIARAANARVVAKTDPGEMTGGRLIRVQIVNDSILLV